MTRNLMFCAAVASLLSLPTTVAAQEQAPTLGGPLVTGICLLSREAVFANTQVGRHANSELQRLAQTAQADIEGERTRLEPELERLELRRPNLQSAPLSEAQRAGLQQAQALQQKIADTSQRIDAARARALTRISEQAQPLIAQVYTRHGCGLLLERAMVLGGNLGNDLTAEVVTAIDARMTTIDVVLEPASR